MRKISRAIDVLDVGHIRRLKKHEAAGGNLFKPAIGCNVLARGIDEELIQISIWNYLVYILEMKFHMQVLAAPVIEDFFR